jgi:hypothetical protein
MDPNTGTDEFFGAGFVNATEVLGDVEDGPAQKDCAEEKFECQPPRIGGQSVAHANICSQAGIEHKSGIEDGRQPHAWRLVGPSIGH